MRLAYNLRYEGDNNQMKFDDFISGHLNDFMDKKWKDASNDDDAERSHDIDNSNSDNSNEL